MKGRRKLHAEKRDAGLRHAQQKMINEYIQTHNAINNI